MSYRAKWTIAMTILGLATALVVFSDRQRRVDAGGTGRLRHGCQRAGPASWEVTAADSIRVRCDALTTR